MSKAGNALQLVLKCATAKGNPMGNRSEAFRLVSRSLPPRFSGGDPEVHPWVNFLSCCNPRDVLEALPCGLGRSCSLESLSGAVLEGEMGGNGLLEHWRLTPRVSVDFKMGRKPVAFLQTFLAL